MSMSTPLDVVDAHYEAITRHDCAALMATLAEDVDWQVVGRDTLAFGGNHGGRAEVQRFFSTIAAACEFLEFAADRKIADGDTVVVLGHERVRVKATKREWSTTWVQVHTVRDNAICRFRGCTDTAAIAAAYAGNSN